MFAGLTNLTARIRLEQLVNRDSGPLYRAGIQSLGLEIRSRCIAGLQSHDRPEPTLEDYQATKLWSERLLRLTLLPQASAFAYPEGVQLTNFDGSKSTYAPEKEQQNWQVPYDKLYLRATDEYTRNAPTPMVRYLTYKVRVNDKEQTVLVRTHLGLEALLQLDEPYGAYEFRRSHEKLRVVPSRIYAAPVTELEHDRIEADYREALLKLGPTPSAAVRQTTSEIISGHLASMRQHLLPGSGTPNLSEGFQDMQHLCRILSLCEKLSLGGVVGNARDDLRSLAGRIASNAITQKPT